MNEYYDLLTRLQDIFHVNYIDKIVNTSRTACPVPTNSGLQEATYYVYCLQRKLVNYASTINTRRRRSLLDLFQSRASNSEINNALATTFHDMEKLHSFSSHILSNEQKLMSHVNKLSTDYNSYSNEQRILTYYIELIKSDRLQDKILQQNLIPFTSMQFTID